jgi:bacterioferritin (cytochrome b1)
MTPMASEGTLDIEQALRLLNQALALQYRSALGYTLAAGGMVGFAYQGLAEKFREFGEQELADARRLVEKITALGGEPATDVAELRWSEKPERMVEWLMDTEEEAIEALQAAIEPTGREGRSEALEHLLEHLIMRKQNQLDHLLRARRSA